MPNGISIKLHTNTTPLANQTGLSCLWWDTTIVANFDYPLGKTAVATTNATGDLILDLTRVSGLAIGGIGYLVVRKENATPQDALVFQGQVTVSNITGGTTLTLNTGWVRPADWPAINDLHTPGENRFEGLYAVYKDGPNPCAFHFTAVDGYTVQWGDGTPNDAIASGVKVEHLFNYNNCPPSSERGISDARACTFQDSGDTVTLNSHGFANGAEIAFSVITTTTGITIYTRYWVRDVTTNTFKAAATFSGAAITLTTDGTGSVYIPIYRVAVIKVTPTTANDFTGCNLAQAVTSMVVTAYSTRWLDMYLNAPALTSFVLRTSSLIATDLERFNCPQWNVTNTNTLFANCYSLEQVWFDISISNNWASIFLGCYSLHVIPPANTSLVSTFNSAFRDCRSLRTIPALNLTNSSNFGNMFNGCLGLNALPAMNIPLADGAGSMFSGCNALTGVPSITTTTAFLTANNMFNLCFELASIPHFNTSASTDFTNFATSCVSLATIPQLQVGAATTYATMFSGCKSLQTGTLSGTKENITYPAMLLSGTALDAIYTGLATVVGKTIIVTGNYGTATHTPSIATAKGWTVTV
jgi:hypothetical protein